ncbi:MAG: NAD kinase, partial [Xanthomonadales bacterium]|nr:NAD kinase [Xanthomonadales bacterium]
MTGDCIHFVASLSDSAQQALSGMIDRYGQCELGEADLIVALGGDGFMLRTLHRFIEADLPVYGMKLGSVGFLMNRYSGDDLRERLTEANQVDLTPLRMNAQSEAGNTVSALAINEVSLLRQTNQAAHIRISVNGLEKVSELVCDGVLLSTAAGSTAYN